MNAWTFVMKEYFFDELKNLEEISWNSPKDIKNGDIIFVYSTSPKKYIDYILKAVSDPYIDPKNNSRLVKLKKEIKLPEPVELHELKDSPILSKWTPINKKNFIFQGAHHKMSEQQYTELKRLILEKNPDLSDQIKKLEERDIDSSQHYWKITPGEWDKRDMLWENFKEDKVIGIGWIGDSVDYSDFNTLDDVRNGLIQFYGEPKEASAKMIWNFIKIIEENDIIIANAGVRKVIGIGVIESEYISPKNTENPAGNNQKARIYKDYVHFRKVKWHITDEIEFDSQFFDQKTITELNMDKWNEIKKLYLKKSQIYKEIFDEIEGRIQEKYPCIPELFQEFKKEFFSSEEGKIHTPKYDLERQKVHKYFEIIKNDIQAINNTNDPPINHLLPIKEPAIAPAAVGDIRAFGYKDEDLPGLTLAIRDLIINLINTDDKEIQQKLIYDFKQGKYKKGFQTAMLTPTLYYLKHNYWFINKKTVANFNLLSEILGENEKITGNLVDYIDNNEKLHRLVDKLKNYIPDLDFESFDAFSHWMCSDNLGNYACDREKFNRRCKKSDPPLIRNPIVSLHPQEIITELMLKSKIKEQVCGSLNAKKHIMLTGAPGTGKTNLAEDVCKVTQKLKFNNGYVLTTATSDWTTFDTIGGYMPDESGKLVFEEGKFLQAIREDKWLIIDEINRADIDKAFGQLFTVLSGQGVELPFKIDGKSVKIQPTEEIGSYFDSKTATYKVGKNWRILATMNIYDKDFLFEMSYAFMRRFTIIYIELPVDDIFIELINEWGKELDEEMLFKVAELLKINHYREIGPAIFKDVVGYIAERKKIGSTDHVLEDAVLSYIMPQFEGLEKPQILEIWNIFNATFDDTDELKRRLEEISTVKLDEIK